MEKSGAKSFSRQHINVWPPRPIGMGSDRSTFKVGHGRGMPTWEKMVDWCVCQLSKGWHHIGFMVLKRRKLTYQPLKWKKSPHLEKGNLSNQLFIGKGPRRPRFYERLSVPYHSSSHSAGVGRPQPSESIESWRTFTGQSTLCSLYNRLQDG